MSTDFVAQLDVSGKDVSSQWLLERILENQAVFEEIVERYRDNWTIKAWSVDGAQSLWGPGCFWMRLGSRAITLGHSIRFGMFAGDPWHRSHLRRVCFFVADLVGSARAIYTHELMPLQEGLVDTEAWLRGNVGPPARTWEQLHVAEYSGPQAWYIDEFTDLRPSPP